MRCPYHLASVAPFSLPPAACDDGGWFGWLVACCGLPVWRCPRGTLHPMEARYCILHGEPRPHPSRMLHECAGMPPPPARSWSLPLLPLADGLSTPCLAGDVLVYLTEKHQLVAVGLGTDASIFLATNVLQASLRLDGGFVRAALRIEGSIRYLRWDVRDLRDALRSYAPPRAAPCSGASSGLLGLPHNHTRLHVGSGLLRLVVEHDPVEDELAKLYHGFTGSWPGPWLIRRTANPDGPPVRDIDIRPPDLWQVPVPIPGGVFLLGVLRVDGRTHTGAVLLPTVRES